MAKTKTNVTDFMDLMDEEINSSERAAFHPKTDNKQVTNGYQTDNGTEKETITNRQQTDSKQIANLSEKNETDNKQVTKRITERITIGQQTDNKQITKSGFESLVGNEKNLLLLIFKECLRIGNLISPEITLSHIYESLKINPGVAKMVIHRLVKKGVIKREISKTGRGGWIKFSIQKELYQDLRIRESDNKEITNGYQSDNKQVTKRVTEQITSGPYSSSNNLNIITTNTDEPEFSAEITLPNNLSRFGISKNNLQKLVDDKLCSLELVQKSIEALSFDVENGKTGNLASILFGILRSGKEYISQRYSETLQQELDQELKRIQETEDQQKRLLEIKLQEKFKTYIDQNPQFIESIKAKHSTFITSTELLEKVALEEFKSLSLEN